MGNVQSVLNGVQIVLNIICRDYMYMYTCSSVLRYAQNARANVLAWSQLDAQCASTVICDAHCCKMLNAHAKHASLAQCAGANVV
jgi:hypothetical protein